MLHILVMVMNTEQSLLCTHTHTHTCQTSWAVFWGGFFLLWRMCTS